MIPFSFVNDENGTSEFRMKNKEYSKNTQLTEVSSRESESTTKNELISRKQQTKMTILLIEQNEENLFKNNYRNNKPNNIKENQNVTYENKLRRQGECS